MKIIERIFTIAVISVLFVYVPQAAATIVYSDMVHSESIKHSDARQYANSSDSVGWNVQWDTLRHNRESNPARHIIVYTSDRGKSFVSDERLDCVASKNCVKSHTPLSHENSSNWLMFDLGRRVSDDRYHTNHNKRRDREVIPRLDDDGRFKFCAGKPNVAPVPIPESLWLFVSGTMLLFGSSRLSKVSISVPSVAS